MLEPYIVLDFTDERGEIGPMLLGDLGADVIRVELPGGSAARTTLPRIANGDPGLESLVFLSFNRNKRSLVLDPDSAADRATLLELVRRTDFVFESWPDSALARYGLDFAALAAANPQIVHVRISPFGSSGPYADLAGSDLVIAALGGPVALQGAASRPPIRLSVPQVWRHAGVEAGVGAMAAQRRMQLTGEAQFVDLSAQATMTWTMLNAMDAAAIQGFDFERGIGYNTGKNRFNLVHPCADGHVLAISTSTVIRGCLDRMIEEGLAETWLRDLDWDHFDRNISDPDLSPFNINQAVELCGSFFANKSKTELFEFGLSQGITIVPVNTLPELLEFPHMAARDYWHPLKLPDRSALRSPGLWAKSNREVLSIRRPAPAIDADGVAIREWLAAPDPRARQASIGPKESDGLRDAPFAGLLVADFSWVGVGPISAKFLADHGARVIRIESETRPDVLRANVPFKDAEPGIDRSQFFGDFNTSKESITLDLKLPEAREIAREIIRRADVMIESFAPGVLGRMGFSYDEVRAINPSIIMVSTCLMGQTGPASQLAGYGYHAGAIAGFYEVTGWPDLAPIGPWVAYTDTVAPRFIAILLAAALDERRRTGAGCYFDVAQIETALHFLAPELLDVQANGVAATRIGNRSTYLAPQGCYRCSGADEWCAIAVETDDAWLALCRSIGRSDLAADQSLATHAGRLAAHDQLDAAIEAWTIGRTREEVMQVLQLAGVSAGVVQRSSDLLADRQYAQRRFYRYFDHPVMGHIPYAGHPYRIAGYDNGPRGPAPTLGEHTLEILTGLLEFDDEALASAYASGAIG